MPPELFLALASQSESPARRSNSAVPIGHFMLAGGLVHKAPPHENTCSRSSSNEPQRLTESLQRLTMSSGEGQSVAQAGEELGAAFWEARPITLQQPTAQQSYRRSDRAALASDDAECLQGVGTVGRGGRGNERRACACLRDEGLNEGLLREVLESDVSRIIPLDHDVMLEPARDDGVR
jgi:hypothetical protein